MGKKILLWVLAILFLLFAFFQWNDPDSLRWIIYYLLIATMCFATIFRRNKSIYLYALLVFSIIWMLTLLPNSIQWMQDGMPTIVDEMKASSSYIELVREFLGLLISIIVLAFLLFLERKGKTRN